MWNIVGVRRHATAFIVAFCFVLFIIVDSQWPNYEVVKSRLPGRCERGEFDCIIGPCIPSFKFNDGHPDCLDGSDEFCFAGHIKCGRQCVDISYAGECLANPNCDGTANAPSFCTSIKTKLCERSDILRCKGYNECVLRKWLLDDNDDCLDASDSDSEYVALMNGIYFDHFVTEPPRVWTLLPFRPGHLSTQTAAPPTPHTPSAAPTRPPTSFESFTTAQTDTSSIPHGSPGQDTESPTTAESTYLSTLSSSTTSPPTTSWTSSTPETSTPSSTTTSTSTSTTITTTTSTQTTSTTSTTTETPSTTSTTTEPYSSEVTSTLTERITTETSPPPTSTLIPKYNHSSVGVPLVIPHNGTSASLTPTSPHHTTVLYPTDKNLSCYENTTLNAISKYPNVRCSCPPGEMKMSNGTCRTVDVATFSAKVSKICDSVSVKAEDEPILVVAKVR
uniref:EB domain-containing protein n=1 Tax=Steinernema glaseri TaxID=37863 RepID=A0A1I7YCB4_9BILA